MNRQKAEILREGETKARVHMIKQQDGPAKGRKLPGRMDGAVNFPPFSAAYQQEKTAAGHFPAGLLPCRAEVFYDHRKIWI